MQLTDSASIYFTFVANSCVALALLHLQFSLQQIVLSKSDFYIFNHWRCCAINDFIDLGTGRTKDCFATFRSHGGSKNRLDSPFEIDNLAVSIICVHI